MSDSAKFIFDSFQDEAIQKELLPSIDNTKEINEAFQSGYNQGFQTGYEQGCVQNELRCIQSSTQKTEEICSKILESIDKLLEKNEALSNQTLSSTFKLTEKIFAILFPFISHAHGLDEVIHQIRYALTNVIEKKPITIQVSHTYLDEVVVHLHDFQKLYQDIKIESSPHLSYGDCIVHWDGGGFFWDQSKILDKIESLLSIKLHTFFEESHDTRQSR